MQGLGNSLMISNKVVNSGAILRPDPSLPQSVDGGIQIVLSNAKGSIIDSSRRKPMRHRNPSQKVFTEGGSSAAHIEAPHSPMNSVNYPL